MNWFILILGYFWAALGIITILFTKTIRKYYGVFIEENHPKSMGALALLVGGLLISSGSGHRLYILIFLLGLTQIIKGIFLLFGSKETVNRLINWWLNTSMVIYRLWGLLTTLMGLALIATLLAG